MFVTQEFFKSVSISLLYLYFPRVNADVFANIELMISLMMGNGCNKANLVILPINLLSDLPTLRPGSFVPDYRKNLYELARLAQNRALFYSYLSQRTDIGFTRLLYYPFSVNTDIAAYDLTSFSSIIFNDNKAKSVWNNQTVILPVFAPCAERNNVTQEIFVTDCGPEAKAAVTYVATKPIMWFSKKVDYQEMGQFKVRKFIDGVEEVMIFYGPSNHNAVAWSLPYLVCSSSTRFYLSVTSPVVTVETATDPKSISNIAFSAITIRFDQIGIDQCRGDRTYNGFAGTDKCKSQSTECEPVPGFGFTRGGYRCVCRLGFTYPDDRKGPFYGKDIEFVPENVYLNPYNFQCIPIQNAIPIVPNQAKMDEAEALFSLASQVSNQSCTSIQDEVVLQNGLANKLRMSTLTQFSSEIHITWRLSLFFSNYLQNNLFALTNGQNQIMPLLKEEVYSELLAILLSHPSIKLVGAYFGENIFPNQQFFSSNTFRAEDGQVFLNASSIKDFTKDAWWLKLIATIMPDVRSLAEFSAQFKIRADPQGTSAKYLGKKTFKGTSRIDSLTLSEPFFSCALNTPILHFGIPFYAPSSKFPDRKVAFGGFVSLLLPLLDLNVDQCDTSEDDMFRGSHLCDRATTECLAVEGRGFRSGGYKCFCKPGYVHPDAVEADYFDGEVVAREYKKLKSGQPNFFETLKCRKFYQ